MSKNILKHQIQGPDGRLVPCTRGSLRAIDGVTSPDPAKLKAGWSVYVEPPLPVAPVAPTPVAQKGR